MEKRLFTAGNAGTDVRSDCQVSLEPRDQGGLIIHLQSRVKDLYGESILAQAREMAAYYGISHAEILIDDSGALPFVLAARTEQVMRSATGSTKDYLPERTPASFSKTKRDRFRLTRLYLPGNTPKLMINAGIHNPDGIILDLEDSVAPARKAEARVLVRNALCALDFYGAERMVRINQVPEGLIDLPWIIPHNVHVILVPKCESAEQIRMLEDRIEELSKGYQLDQRPFLMPIIESALGIEKAFEIATASKNIIAMAIGLEDYTADLGTRRTKEGEESIWARQRMVNACKAAGIQPIDSVFSDVDDMDELLKQAVKSKALGFEGMGCIHPRQIEVIRKGFMPAPDEITRAQKIVEAFQEAESKGLGVVSLGNKMIDPPVVKRALQTLELARIFNLT
ncbi:MAG: aldolase/citrate lyase family protein [Bacteroidales bacterium]